MALVGLTDSLRCDRTKQQRCWLGRLSIFSIVLSQCPFWNPTSVNLLIFGVAKSFWVNHFPLAINGRAKKARRPSGDEIWARQLCQVGSQKSHENQESGGAPVRMLRWIYLLVLNAGNGWEWGLLGWSLITIQIIPSFPTFSTSKFMDIHPKN